MKTPTISAVLNFRKQHNKTNKYAVHVRITLNRESRFIRIPTPLMVTPEQWNGKESKWINETHPYAFEINDRIREVKYKIEEVVKRFYMHNKQISFHDILYHMRKKGDNILFNDFVAEYIRLKPEKLEIATWEKYTTFLNHLNDFNPAIPFMNLNAGLVKAFKLYLQEKKGFTGSTMKIYFDKFKKVVHYAEKENYVDENQTRFLFDELSIKVDKPKRIYLEIEEIKKLKSIEFTAGQQERERDRDLFLFQLYTGSYYNDLMIMRKSQLVIDPEYGYFIMGDRDKNGNERIIPLFKFPHAQYLLDKYMDTNPAYEFVFPKKLFINDHVYNKTLKRIAKSVGITKEVTAKVARHTNAQLWIRYGANKPVVSKMMGHLKEETTNHYYSINIPEVIEGTKGVDFDALGI